MKPTPPYWARHDEQVTANGRRLDLRMWGCSWNSVHEAARVAAERVADLVAAGGPGPRPVEQYYPRVPLREEVLRQLHSGDTLVAEVTRNRYGATVLNTDLVLIADIDLPAEPRRRGLFRRRPTGPSAEDQTRERITGFARANPQWGLRVYRTFGGFRVLVLGADAAPGSTRATEILTQLGSDPLYVTLCRTHETFRARVSPKPWRLDSGIRALPVQWPAEEQLDRYRRWVADYDQAAAHHATCRLETATPTSMSDAEAAIVDLHDTWSKADVDLPLA